MANARAQFGRPTPDVDSRPVVPGEMEKSCTIALNFTSATDRYRKLKTRKCALGQLDRSRRCDAKGRPRLLQPTMISTKSEKTGGVVKESGGSGVDLW